MADTQLGFLESVFNEGTFNFCRGLEHILPWVRTHFELISMESSSRVSGLFIYFKSSKLYKVAHPTRGVLTLEEYNKFLCKKY